MSTTKDLAIQPYMFEPELDTERDNKDNENDEPAEQRLHMDVSQWCSCGNCATMPTEAENRCCRETPKVTARMKEVSSQLTCMVDHPGFEPVCLNEYSLQNAINVYKAQYGPLHLRGMVHRYRYCAYRCFVSWCWGYLGRKVRVVLPCCVVLRIRQEFPDDEGKYVGFRPVLD